jgi:hypothetical protein
MECYYRMGKDRIRWNQIPYHKSGNKPFTRKEKERIIRMDDQFEKKYFEIRLGLQAYDPNYPPSDPIILKPELDVKPCPVSDQIGHKAVDCPELCNQCAKTGDCNHIRAGP